MTPRLATLTLAAALALCGAAPAAPAEPTPPVQYLNRAGIVAGTLPFSEAVRVGNLVFLSGQLGVLPGKMQLAPGGIKAETAQALENIKTVLASVGLGLNDVVKCTAMLADMAEWPAFNEVYRTYFTAHLPARSAFGATGLALGGRVEIECIAAAGN